MSHPAFPHTREQIERGEEGMSLRDYFAAAALSGELSNFTKSDYHEQLAVSCYAMADAMLKAKEQ